MEDVNVKENGNGVVENGVADSLGDLSGLIPQRKRTVNVSTTIPRSQEDTHQPPTSPRRTSMPPKLPTDDHHQPPTMFQTRPATAHRVKSTPTGFSTVTPSRPNFMAGKPRRPLSAPNGNGMNSPRLRSRSDSPNSPHVKRRSSPESSVLEMGLRRPSTASVDSVGSTPTLNEVGEEESYFVLARLEEEKEAAAAEGEGKEGKEEQKKGGWFSLSLQASFQAVRESMMGEGKQEDGKAEQADETDWEFWGKVMNDYETTVRKHPRTFTRKLLQGIPDSLRGMVWQLICKGKDPDLENIYANLITRTSIHEKVIQRDLARTFPKHERFAEPGGPGQESLFNIIKAYSLYDTEIGYCQGIAFVVGALLLNMPDEEAFCVLVRLMKNYNLRDLYTPQMLGLQLRLYQFDELLHENFPSVSRHLENQEVKSTMYASQWFMTMFAYRFPLSAVFRIMDVIFAEGVDSMLKIALALIKRNAETIVTLEFEPLLEFLKNGLFDIYADNIHGLLIDAANVKVTKTRLEKLKQEHDEAVRMSSPDYMETEALRIEVRRMTETIRRMEMEYEILNREHVDLANQLLEQTVKAENFEGLSNDLTKRVRELEEAERGFQGKAEERVQGEMERLARKNLELTSRNAELEEEVEGLKEEVGRCKGEWAKVENERAELERKWEGLRRVIG